MIRKLIGHCLIDDETLRGNTGLAVVEHATEDRFLRSKFEVGILQHNVRVAAAEFE